MDKEKKNRSGSQSNDSSSGNNEHKGHPKKTSQPGGDKSNRGKEGHQRDDSSRGAEHNTTKKGANSI